MDLKTLIRSHRPWVIMICGFVLLVTFFDSDNLLGRIEIKKRIRELEKQKEYYLQRIEEDSTLLENLKHDDFLEQYARERFMMKRDGEVLFLIEE